MAGGISTTISFITKYFGAGATAAVKGITNVKNACGIAARGMISLASSLGRRCEADDGERADRGDQPLLGERRELQREGGAQPRLRGVLQGKGRDQEEVNGGQANKWLTRSIWREEQTESRKGAAALASPCAGDTESRTCPSSPRIPPGLSLVSPWQLV